MLPTEDRKARSAESLANALCIVHVVGDLLGGLGGTGLGENRGCGLLDHVGDRVELGRVAPGPERVEGDRFALGAAPHHGFRDRHIGAPRSGKARALGETAHFDGALPGALDLEDRARKVRVLDEGIVGGVEENRRLVASGPVDPLGQVFPGGDGARGVVGGAQVREVHAFIRGTGHEGIGFGRGQVDDALVATGVVRLAGAPGHHVGVHVDGVTGIGDAEAGTEIEDLLDVPTVLLAAVGDEDLAGFEGDAEGRVIVGADGFR